MKRRITRAIVVFCLLLAAAVAAMWVRSYRWSDWVYRRRGSEYVAVRSQPGQVIFEWERDPTVGVARHWNHGRRPTADFDLIDVYRGAPVRRFFGFAHYDHQSADGAFRRIALGIPFWSLVVPPLIAPAVAFARRRRNRARELEHRCLHCGYDLRASRDRCPECGAAIARA